MLHAQRLTFGPTKPPDMWGVDYPCSWSVLIILIFLTCSISSQSCHHQRSIEESDCFSMKHASLNQDTASTVDAFTHADPIGSETGLDFIQSGKLDVLFVGNDTDTLKRRGEISALALSQMFIRNIKGLPMEKDEDDNETAVIGGNNLDKKPAWCFYPFLLKKLVLVERKLYESLKEFKEGRSDTRIPILESYLQDIEESTLRAIKNVEASNEQSSNPEDPYLYVSAHPSLIYRLIRRFVEDLHPILRILEEMDEDFMDWLYGKDVNPELLVFPTKTDLDDALELIARMQRGNDLNSYEMARGVFEKVETGIRLNALHCLEIGASYLERKEYDYSIQWFHIALETALKSDAIKFYPDIQMFFKYALETAIKEHNENFHNSFANRWDPWVFNSTISLPFKPNSYTRRFHQLRPQASEERHITTWNWATRVNFIRTCSGENLQTEAEKAALKCWYHRRHHPYWYINPLKMELLHMNPPVFQMYDFIGDKLAERMKEAAISQLKRSTVVDRSTATGTKVDSTRTSSQTWLYDTTDTFIQPLTRRFEIMSGLTIMPPTSSDAYQVAAYGPSHHYEAHIDSFEDPRRCVDQGNRITTIMGYLSHVKAGGRTGFPVLGISAEPIKGSIVMWDNTKRNGEKRDERTWHGGCPVVLGIKWITNKWVYYKDNMFNFRCTLDPME